MGTLKRVPVIGKDLLEDTPVPRGWWHHRIAPSRGHQIVAVKRLYHASAASSTPHRLLLRDSHPPQSPWNHGDFRTAEKCIFLYDQVSALRADCSCPSRAWLSSNLTLKAVLSARAVAWAFPHPRSLQRWVGYRDGDHNALA